MIATTHLLGGQMLFRYRVKHLIWSAFSKISGLYGYAESDRRQPNVRAVQF
jgi:hypothetical protein